MFLLRLLFLYFKMKRGEKLTGKDWKEQLKDEQEEWKKIKEEGGDLNALSKNAASQKPITKEEIKQAVKLRASRKKKGMSEDISDEEVSGLIEGELDPADYLPVDTSDSDEAQVDLYKSKLLKGDSDKAKAEINRSLELLNEGAEDESEYEKLKRSLEALLGLETAGEILDAGEEDADLRADRLAEKLSKERTAKLDSSMRKYQSDAKDVRRAAERAEKEKEKKDKEEDPVKEGNSFMQKLLKPLMLFLAGFGVFKLLSTDKGKELLGDAAVKIWGEEELARRRKAWEEKDWKQLLLIPIKDAWNGTKALIKGLNKKLKDWGVTDYVSKKHEELLTSMEDSKAGRVYLNARDTAIDGAVSLAGSLGLDTQSGFLGSVYSGLKGAQSTSKVRVKNSRIKGEIDDRSKLTTEDLEPYKERLEAAAKSPDISSRASQISSILMEAKEAKTKRITAQVHAEHETKEELKKKYSGDKKKLGSIHGLIEIRREQQSMIDAKVASRLSGSSSSSVVNPTSIKSESSSKEYKPVESIESGNGDGLNAAKGESGGGSIITGEINNTYNNYDNDNSVILIENRNFKIARI